MAGDPHSQMDDYTIEEKEKDTRVGKISIYNGTSQYQSANKQKQLNKKSDYGLPMKNPIKKLSQAKKGKPLQRERGCERD